MPARFYDLRLVTNSMTGTQGGSKGGEAREAEGEDAEAFEEEACRQHGEEEALESFSAKSNTNSFSDMDYAPIYLPFVKKGAWGQTNNRVMKAISTDRETALVVFVPRDITSSYCHGRV